jgi:hypothetical protein
MLVAEFARTETGSLTVRGPMVPRHPFPPGVERTALPHLRIDRAGYVDTGYACRTEHGINALVVTAPPPGIVSVGGYRFLLRDLNQTAKQAEVGAALTPLPDALTGQRLAGSAPDRAAARTMLAALGVNPLVADAFRDRRSGPPAA